LQPRLRDTIHHSVEAAEHVAVHSVRLRLKAIPHQKEANDVEPELFDPHHIFGDLVDIELLPHVHRTAARPIVDAEQKA
jgi:hypothetical protein